MSDLSVTRKVMLYYANEHLLLPLLPRSALLCRHNCIATRSLFSKVLSVIRQLLLMLIDIMSV
jgi:hypothetical protein